MKFKLGLALGAGAGYLVGSGKGHELVETAKRTWENAGSKSSGAKPPVDSTPAGSESEIARLAS